MLSHAAHCAAHYYITDDGMALVQVTPLRRTIASSP